MSELGELMYENESNMINQNLWNFRTDTNRIRSINQELIQEQKTNDLLEVVKDGAQELGIRTFNELVGKYGGAAYRYKSSLLGNNSLADLDAKLGENITDRLNEGGEIIGKGLSNLKNRILLPREYSLGSQKISLQDLGIGFKNLDQNSHSVLSGLGDDPEFFDRSGSKALSEWNESNPDSQISDESFDTFMRNRTNQIERDQDGQMVFEPIQTNAENRSLASNRPMVDDELGAHDEEIGNQENMTLYENEAKDIDHSSFIRENGEMTMGQENLMEDVGDVAGHSGVESAETAAGSSAEKIAAEGAEAAGKTAARAAGEETAGAVAETVGGILDSTGFLAPFGFLFNAAGAALDTAGIVQGAEGVGKFVSQDILKNSPTYRDPTLELPQMPQTQAMLGYGLTPSYDSLNMMMPSSSW